MVSRHREEPGVGGAPAPRALTLAGVLLFLGFVVNGIQRMALHPTGAEDDHEAIFGEYADSEVWVFTHFLEFILVLVAFAGFLVLCHLLRGDTPYISLFAAAAILVASACWAVLQGVDGVALKETVDDWVAASGTPHEAARFADAETVRWLEWGIQAYFRVILGAALLLLGGAIVLSRLLQSWLGVLLAIAGLLSIAIGVSVGYAGLESDFQDPTAIAFQLIVLVFIVGLLAAARRAPEASGRGATS